MPSLTPLHFIRRIQISNARGVQDIGAYYGLCRYVTDCGRFIIGKDDAHSHSSQLWCIREYRSSRESNKAARKSGILDEQFESRKAALEALDTLCHAEGI